MQINVTRDPDDKQILSVYVRLATGVVDQTLELAESACYVDIDGEGNPLGIEIVAPGAFKLKLRDIRKHLDTEALQNAFDEVEEVVAGLDSFVAA